MNLTTAVPIAVAFISLVGSLAALLVSIPKARAEAGSIQATAVVTLINGFTTLDKARQEQITELQKDNANLKVQAAMSGQFARRCEQLELELKLVKAHSYQSECKHNAPTP